MQHNSTIPRTPPHIDGAQRAAILAGMRSEGRQWLNRAVCDAFIYARESDPDLQDSIPHQLDECRRYAERHGLVVVREFSDGMSGLDNSRPDYKRMLDAFDRGQAGHLILWETSRFGRDDVEFITAMDRLMERGVTIHDTNDGTLSRDDVARLAYEANREARKTSHRTRSKMRFNAGQGRPQGTLPLGLTYDYDHDDHGERIKPGRLAIDPKAGPAVLRCMRDYAAGKSRRAVTDQLNAELGLHRTPPMVGRLMKNRLLKGVYVYGRTSHGKITGNRAWPQDDWIVSRAEVQLVDDETFDMVQARMAQHDNGIRERPGGRGDLLQGVLWCGACNKRMYGHTRSKGWDLYECGTCHRGRSLKKIEAALLQYFYVVPNFGRLPFGFDADAADRAYKAAVAAVQALQPSLDAITAERVELTRQHARHEINAKDYHATIAVTDSERDKIKAELEEAEAKVQHAAAAQAWIARHRLVERPDGSRGVVIGTGDLKLCENWREYVYRVVYERASDTLRVEWRAATGEHMPDHDHVINIKHPVGSK